MHIRFAWSDFGHRASIRHCLYVEPALDARDDLSLGTADAMVLLETLVRECLEEILDLSASFRIRAFRTLAGGN